MLNCQLYREKWEKTSEDAYQARSILQLQNHVIHSLCLNSYEDESRSKSICSLTCRLVRHPCLKIERDIHSRCHGGMKSSTCGLYLQVSLHYLVFFWVSQFPSLLLQSMDWSRRDAVCDLLLNKRKTDQAGPQHKAPFRSFSRSTVCSHFLLFSTTVSYCIH